MIGIPKINVSPNHKNNIAPPAFFLSDDIDRTSKGHWTTWRLLLGKSQANKKPLFKEVWLILLEWEPNMTNSSHL